MQNFSLQLIARHGDEINFNFEISAVLRSISSIFRKGQLGLDEIGKEKKVH